MDCEVAQFCQLDELSPTTGKCKLNDNGIINGELIKLTNGLEENNFSLEKFCILYWLCLLTSE